jgi:hypothetical protein
VRNVAKTGGTKVGTQIYGAKKRLNAMQALGRMRKELEG